MMMMMMWFTAMLFNKLDSAKSDYAIQPNPTISADVGDNVTLHCFIQQDYTSGSIVWYKQKVGYKPFVMVTVNNQLSYEDEFNSPRFQIEKKRKSCHLKISNVEPSDEAMYYCGYRPCSTTFGNGTFLSVKGKPDFRVSVWQRGVSDSVPAGASVTLQCSVLSESRAAELQVLWFRAAPPQSHPQIIYTHHNSSHQCESGSSTHTCVYNFSKNILSLNDTGTYYCAVAVCGKIIFGNGTRVQLSTFPHQTFQGSDSVVIGLAVALAVCVVVIFAQAIVYSKKLNSVKPPQGSMIEKTHTQDRDAVETKYAALHFNERKTISARGKKRQPQDTVYSEVIHSPVT